MRILGNDHTAILKRARMLVPAARLVRLASFHFRVDNVLRPLLVPLLRRALLLSDIFSFLCHSAGGNRCTILRRPQSIFLIARPVAGSPRHSEKKAR